MYLIDFLKKINKNKQINKGMTYVELIVVLGIFSILYGVVIFNYQSFQERISMRNLATEIATTIVKAQKNAVSGLLPIASFSSEWKPSYGVYFNMEENPNTGNKVFYYYTDINPPFNRYDELFVCPSGGVSECLERINITRGNYISEIRVYDQSQTGGVAINRDLHINFTRPDTSASIQSSVIYWPISMVDITISAPSNASSIIRVYSSGRIDII